MKFITQPLTTKRTLLYISALLLGLISMVTFLPNAAISAADDPCAGLMSADAIENCYARHNSTAEKSLCEGSGGTYAAGKCTTAGKPQTLEGVIGIITKTLLFLVGAIAVIMLIIGGLRYVLSGGDQKSVTDAKNTILYAVIGIIIAFAGYAIVDFVVDEITRTPPPAADAEGS